MEAQICQFFPGSMIQAFFGPILKYDATIQSIPHQTQCAPPCVLAQTRQVQANRLRHAAARMSQSMDCGSPIRHRTIDIQMDGHDSMYYLTCPTLQQLASRAQWHDLNCMHYCPPPKGHVWYSGLDDASLTRVLDYHEWRIGWWGKLDSETHYRTKKWSAVSLGKIKTADSKSDKQLGFRNSWITWQWTADA